MTAAETSESSMESTSTAVEVAPRPSLRIVPGRSFSGPLASRSQRRGVGMWLVILGGLVDAAIITAVPAILFADELRDNTRGAGRLWFIYTVVALALVAPGMRRGRQVHRPSETLGFLVTRLGLAPVITVVVSRWAYVLDETVWLGLVCITVPAVLVGRLVVFKLTHVVRSRGYDLEDTLIVGSGPMGRGLALAMEHNPEMGLTPMGFVDDETLDDVAYPVFGVPADLAAIIEETGARHVVLAFSSTPDEDLVDSVRRCAALPALFYVVPRFFELGVSVERDGFEIDGIALVRLRRPGHGHGAWWSKRVFDIVVSGLLMIVTFPLFLATAIAVKMTSPGPVFFRQLRVGLNGVPFEMIKFRSMTVNDDESTQWTVDDDERVTTVGAFIRRSHIDELPQLLNVLRGDMSIVGPRPERPHFVDQFTEEIDRYDDRHRVPVGITGWAQVHGFWGDSSIETRVRLDNRYIENWSPWRDLVIGLRTIPTLLGKRR